MKGIRSLPALLAAGGLLLGAGTSTAAPKNYVYTGKFTSNRGILINIPVGGVVPCGGVGLSNLRIMSGPGLTGPHTPLSKTAMTMQPNPTPTMHVFSQFANGNKRDYGCVGYNPTKAGLKAGLGKKVVTTGAGVGGAFTFPDHVHRNPFPTKSGHTATTAEHVPNATPVIQLATAFSITGPRKITTVFQSKTPPNYKTHPGAVTAWKANWRKFHKSAYKGQPLRVQGAKFTYCWGNPACTKIAGGTEPLIVKNNPGPNKFGGTMSYIIHSGSGASNLALGVGGGAVAFALLKGSGSQVTGRGYAVKLTDFLQSGPIWGKYMTGVQTKPRLGQQKLITTIGLYNTKGMFPPANNFNRGFPFTTGTVLARNTGTAAGQKRDTTLTAMGGDTVTAMGKRNISLVAGGIARAALGPITSNTPEIGQLFVPEPSRMLELVAGVAALLGIAAWRARGTH